MNNIEVKIIIGSNYGDEGKGLAAHYFSQNAKKKNKKCLNVLFNGGCQRGHTVDLKDNNRHVFHHFGSGTYDSAHTYLDDAFIINPIFFMEEYEELCNSGIKPICLISPICKVSTPYDMIINQIVEQERKNNKHGSCGFGIYETIQRYENSIYSWTFSEMVNHTDEELEAYLCQIANKYVPNRLKQYGINHIPDKFQSIINSKILITNFVNDFKKMQSKVYEIFFEKVVENYDVIVFEGAQGLELDKDNIKGFPHLTPSKTTSQTPLKKSRKLTDKDIEICYVTRSYFTRHGAGKFPTECDKNVINAYINDMTNVDNEFQDSLRYGQFDKDEFLERVTADINLSKQIPVEFITSVFITHLNYTNGELKGNCGLNDIVDIFDKVYLSNSKYSEDVKMEESKWQ